MKGGSLTFSTTIINTDEYMMIAKIKVKEVSVEIAALEIDYFDDILVLIRQRSMLNAMRRTPTGRIRKNSDFLSLLNNRTDQLIKDIHSTNKP